MRTLALAVVASLAACSSSETPAPRAEPAAPPVLVASSQHDLVRELAEADTRGTWAKVKQRWQGQTVRWTVTRHRAFCRSATACNVAAFPIQRPAQQGWLPEIAFAPGQYEAMERQCAGAETCEVTLDGTLAQLEASPELPTSVTIRDARLATRTASR